MYPVSVCFGAVRHGARTRYGGQNVGYIGSAWKYVFKNFIFLFLFALIPSYFFALALDLQSLETIARNLLELNAEVSFVTVFNCFSFINGSRWPFALVCFACLAIFMPMILAFIEKHMRIGSRSLKGIFGRINYNFLSTFLMLVVAIAVYELWALLASGLVYVAVIAFGGAARTVVAIVVALGMCLLLSYIFSLFWLWLPCRQITGYCFADAMVFANQAISSKRKKLYLAVMLPYLAGVALLLLVVGVCSAFDVIVPVFVFIEIIFILLFLYFCALMFVAYFDAAGEERADLRKRY